MIKRYEIDGGWEGWREREHDNGQWVLFDDCEKPLAIAEAAVKYVRLSEKRKDALKSGTSVQEDVKMCGEVMKAWEELWQEVYRDETLRHDG